LIFGGKMEQFKLMTEAMEKDAAFAIKILNN